MPTLEQVCKRIFSDPNWLVKCIVGGLLFAIPMFPLGYFYALMEKARRGEVISLPEWAEWKELFFNGVAFLAIFAILGGIPLAIGWLLSLPLSGWMGPLGRLPLIPAVLLAAPLSAAGVYRYQRRENFRDAFRLPVLLAMLERSKSRFLIPTFGLIGFLVAGFPLLPWACFIGGAAVYTYYAVVFRFLEETRKSAEFHP